MADEKQVASDRHYDAMKRLQNLREDVKKIFDDTIKIHYDNPPQSLASEQTERSKLREDLRDIIAQVNQTYDEL